MIRRAMSTLVAKYSTDRMVRDYVRLYCHLGGGKMEDFYETSAEDAKRFADLAEMAVVEGFTGFKCMATPPTLPLEGTVAVILVLELTVKVAAMLLKVTAVAPLKF